MNTYSKPNIVVMLMDNLGHGDLGCTGSKLHRTPNVDRLAREGMRFESYYLPLANKIMGLGGKRAASAAMLFDVRNDPAEMKEAAAEHPDVVARLLAMAGKAREDLGDENREGRDQRPAGWVENPTPRLLQS